LLVARSLTQLAMLADGSLDVLVMTRLYAGSTGCPGASKWDRDV